MADESEQNKATRDAPHTPETGVCAKLLTGKGRRQRQGFPGGVNGANDLAVLKRMH